ALRDALPISRGVHTPGDRLPTEAELSQRFDVNRHTVRRAIAELVAEGLLRVEQGRGTFVQQTLIEYPLRRRTRFTENVLQARGAPAGRLLETARLAADESVAAALEIEAGADVILISRVGQVDDRPMNIGTHYFPAARFPQMIEIYRETASITRALERQGVGDYTRKVTRITARMPTREEAELLMQPANRPVMQTEAINVDPSGRPVEYGIGCFSAERVQFVVESWGRGGLAEPDPPSQAAFMIGNSGRGIRRRTRAAIVCTILAIVLGLVATAARAG